MQFILVNANDGAVDLVHLSYLFCEESVAFDDIVVEFVPFRCGGELGAWKFREGVEGEAVDD